MRKIHVIGSNKTGIFSYVGMRDGGMGGNAVNTLMQVLRKRVLEAIARWNLFNWDNAKWE